MAQLPPWPLCSFSVSDYVAPGRITGGGGAQRKSKSDSHIGRHFVNRVPQKHNSIASPVIVQCFFEHCQCGLCSTLPQSVKGHLLRHVPPQERFHELALVLILAVAWHVWRLAGCIELVEDKPETTAVFSNHYQESPALVESAVDCLLFQPWYWLRDAEKTPVVGGYDCTCFSALSLLETP